MLHLSVCILFSIVAIKYKSSKNQLETNKASLHHNILLEHLYRDSNQYDPEYFSQSRCNLIRHLS